MNSYVREKHTLDDIYWRDFEEIIRHYINAIRFKFPVFKTLIECELYSENIKFHSDEHEMKVMLYEFDNGGKVYYSFCVRKNTRSYISSCYVRRK